jgi:hypothetical protein
VVELVPRRRLLPLRRTLSRLSRPVSSQRDRRHLWTELDRHWKRIRPRINRAVEPEQPHDYVRQLDSVTGRFDGC